MRYKTNTSGEHEKREKVYPVTTLLALSEAKRQLVFDRFQLLRPHLEDGAPLTRITQQHGLPLR